jgi:hypothetical protein
MSEDNCGVCLGEFDGDPCTIWREAMPVARKAHQCSECGDAIAPGTRYESISMLFEGKFDTYKVCAACSDIGKSLSCDGSRPLGFLWESVRDVFPEMTQACVDKLRTAAGKRKLTDEWKKWKGLPA